MRRFLWGQTCETGQANSVVLAIGGMGEQPPMEGRKSSIAGLNGRGAYLPPCLLRFRGHGARHERRHALARGEAIPGSYSLINRNKLKKPLFHAGSSPISPTKT